MVLGHDNSGFQPQPYWETLRDAVNKKEYLQTLIEGFQIANSIPEEDFDIMLTIMYRTRQEFDLMTLCELGESINKINWFYFRSGFLQEYINQIPQLVYPNWYSASFISEFPENSVLWGHYGDSHRGVCLIFKIYKEPHQGNLHMLLKRPESSNGDSDAVKIQLKNITYADERESEVEFFKRLWTNMKSSASTMFSKSAGKRWNAFSATMRREHLRTASTGENRALRSA